MIKKFEDYSININKSVMNINDLSEMTSRLGVEKEDMIELIQRAFRNDGDNGVIEIFKEITGIEIEALSRGRYVFKYFK